MSPVRPVRRGVIPAGGLGTRFLPITRTVPKELLPLVDTAVIELVAGEMSAAGVRDIVVVIAPGKEMLVDYFRPVTKLEQRLGAESRDRDLDLLRRPERLARIQTAVQHEPKGNGHAVLQARPLIGDEPFAMLWGDDVVLGEGAGVGQLIAARERMGGGSVVGSIRVPKERSGAYGVIAGEPAGGGVYRVSAIIEKPRPDEAPSDLAAVHGYVLEPEVFEILESMPPGRNGEVWLSDAVSALAKRGQPVWAVELAGQRYDTGDRLGYVTAFVDAALARADVGEGLRAHLRAKGWVSPTDR